ncbi:MAG: hypothetical protein KF858_08030 [Candidatus Sumerlaeia bacterium]|nr:hypothetical protein [Candidatus Sumerlaeia bacterium]
MFGKGIPKGKAPKPGVQPVEPREFHPTAPPAAGAAPVAPPTGPQPVLEVQAMPTSGHKFSCARCGAGLAYSPGVADLACEHCGHVTHIPQSESEVEELSFEKYFESGAVAEEVLEGVANETRCPGCGAVVELSAQIAHDLCPFCGSHLTNRVEAAQPMMRPGGVLPFRIEQRDARARFAQWVKSRWFAPGDFGKLDKLDRVNGLYVPYWTYDAMTFSFFTGMRGDAYYVTVGTGKNRRTQRRIRWTPVSGTIRHFFDDVLVCGSKSLPDKQLQALEPWDLKKAEPYDAGYLAGYQTERYQVSALDGFKLARSVMDREIDRMVRMQIGGDEQRVSSISTQHEGITFKLLLLPVWLSVYRYGDKPYRVLINARTGEVQGERPWSVAKIGLTVLFALAVLVPLILAIVRASS